MNNVLWKLAPSQISFLKKNCWRSLRKSWNKTQQMQSQIWEVGTHQTEVQLFLKIRFVSTFSAKSTKAHEHFHKKFTRCSAYHCPLPLRKFLLVKDRFPLYNWAWCARTLKTWTIGVDACFSHTCLSHFLITIFSFGSRNEIFLAVGFP